MDLQGAPVPNVLADFTMFPDEAILEPLYTVELRPLQQHAVLDAAGLDLGSPAYAGMGPDHGVLYDAILGYCHWASDGAVCDLGPFRDLDPT